MSEIRIEAVDALDFRMTSGVWDFAITRADEIAAHWRRRHAEQPKLFNGRVLMLSRHAVEGRTLRGEFIETDFADFLAWRDFGFPASNACNGFSMAALRGANGAFLLGGNVSPHRERRRDLFPRRHAGPAGRIRRRRRSRSERAARADRGDRSRPRGGRDRAGLAIVRAPGRVACMKPMRLRMSAEETCARRDAVGERSAARSSTHSCRAQLGRFSPRMSDFVAPSWRMCSSASTEGRRLPYPLRRVSPCPDEAPPLGFALIRRRAVARRGRRFLAVGLEAVGRPQTAATAARVARLGRRFVRSRFGRGRGASTVSSGGGATAATGSTMGCGASRIPQASAPAGRR